MRCINTPRCMLDISLPHSHSLSLSPCNFIVSLHCSRLSPPSTPPITLPKPYVSHGILHHSDSTPPPNAPLRLRGGCGLWGYGEQWLWLCGGELFHGLAEVAADEDVVEDATFGCRSGGAGRDCSSCKFTIGTLTTWILQGRWCFGFGNGGGGGA